MPHKKYIHEDWGKVLKDDIGELPPGSDDADCKKAKDDLKKYRHIFECVNDVIFIVNPGGDIVDVNKKAIGQYGYSKKELLSMNVIDLRVPSERPYLPEQLKRCFTEECAYKTIHQRKDGSAFPIEVSARGISIDGQSVIAGVIRDISEHKKAEETWSRLVAIVEYSHDALLNVGLDGTILTWNKGAERIYGYTAKNVVGKNVSILIPKKLSSDLDFILNTVKSGKPVDGYETVRKRKDGKNIDIIIVASPIVNSSGNVESISWMARDITKRKLIERDLKDSEERFRAIFEQAAVGITQMSLDGRYIRVNKKFCDIHGFNKEEIIQKNIKDITYPTDIDYVFTYLRRLIAGEIPNFSIEKRNVRKDGSIIWIVTTVSLIRDSGKPKCFIGIIEDVTNRKRIEDALRYSEEKFRAVYEGAAIGILMADVNGIIIDTNKSFASMLDCTREELIHRSVENITYLEDYGKDIAHYKRMVDGEINHYQIEMRYVRKDGGSVWTRMTSSGVRDIKGELAFSIRMVEDITKRKSAEEELLGAKEQAELYLDVMCHDIQNINQVAMGYLELAHDTLGLTGESKELIKKPLEAISNSSKLIDNIRKLKEVREKEHRYEVVDVNEMLKEVISAYSNIPNRKVDIDYNPEPDTHCKVKATLLLRDVFTNLIGNSIKHSTGSLKINIKLDTVKEAGTQYSRVSIEDNGQGIPDARKCTIFERFNKTTEKFKGKGLGLYIVKTLLNEFNGNIWVEDLVPGDYTKGVRFVVVLPAVEK